MNAEGSKTGLPCGWRLREVSSCTSHETLDGADNMGEFMSTFSRRRFLQTGAACAVLGSNSRLSANEWVMPQREIFGGDRVHFLFDGLSLTPLEYARLYWKLGGSGEIKRDSYLAGGTVEELEKRFALELGKERAVFLPTGTLANHLALRTLSAGKSRALVQAESHIYNDSNDCVESLSQLNLIPLAEGKATFTLAQVESAVNRAKNGPFPLQVGAIGIECPVRRQQGQVFDFEEMKRISTYARKNSIKLHLDGARLYVASAYTGIVPSQYAELFDTVYISLYKYFNAPGGAILAGPKEIVEKVAHGRKLFGSGVYQGWPQAAVALYYFDGFRERFKKATGIAQEIFAELNKQAAIRIEPIPGGTNIVKLLLNGIDVKEYQAQLGKRGIQIHGPSPDFHGTILIVNESLNSRPAAEIAKAFVESLPKA
jgi:threonine aldolase